MELNGFPAWERFTPAAAAAELPRLLVESEKAVSAIERSRAPRTYDGVIHALEDATRELWTCWGMVQHINSVMNSPAWRRLEERFQPQMVAFSLRVGQSGSLYSAMKAARKSSRLDAVKRRILDKAIKGAELAGVALAGAKKRQFNDIQAKLARLMMDFSNSVIDATKAFKFRKGGKLYTIDDAAYPETMKHCADRAVREKLYHARSGRAPENSARIAEILDLRARLAKLLGFGNYAEYSLATKCAPSTDAVLAMIDRLDAATACVAERENHELASMAPGLKIEPWDVAFLAEQLREKKYAYSEDDFKRHYEFEKTLKGLFRLVKFLFNVEVEELKGRAKPQVWHPDVRFFAVKENGRVIAHFYLDAYVRNGQKSGGAWMNEFRNRNDRLGVKPLAVIVLNLPRPDARGKTLMPLREVETLFHEFGHACQHMLTRIGEEGAAGISLVEWDAVEVASQFMENWCFDSRTGIKVPSTLKAKVKAAKNFRAASACRRQLAFAKTDMMLHIGPVKSADAVKNRVFTHFGVPVSPGDLFLNSFTHIFAGGYAAGYYGYKWAEVMSADCFGAFEAAGIANDLEMKRLGNAYRETVLGLGGSVSAYDVFRKFRRRKPSINALLRQQGLSLR